MRLSFLESRTGRPWNYDRGGDDFEYYQGQGASQLEIAVADHGERPTKEFLRKTYSDRRGNRSNPILIVAIYDDKVGLCGPSGEDPPIYRDVDRGQAERVCDAALDKPDRFTAQQFLSEMLPQLDEELTGLRNQGLLSTHELRVGVPERDDWEDATEQARRALDDDDPREMVKGLNYEIDQLTDQSYVLKDSSDGHERAVAMFLQEDESLSPVGKSRKLVDKVEDLGLQPYEAPDPLPQLEEQEEVKLVCWMAIAPESENDAEERAPSLMSQVEVDTFETQ